MTLSSTPEQLQDNNLPNLEAHLQSIVDFFHNGNFKYCVRVANNFISETGFNLTKVRNIYPEESFPSDREIFRSEESVLSFLINYIIIKAKAKFFLDIILLKYSKLGDPSGIY